MLCPASKYAGEGNFLQVYVACRTEQEFGMDQLLQGAQAGHRCHLPS